MSELQNPKQVEIRAKIRRSTDQRISFDQVWGECDNFYAGVQDIWRTWDGKQIRSSAIGDTPGWRNRYVYNQVSTRCDREIASYTAQFPSYEVDPAPPVGANSATVSGQSSVSASVAGERILSHLFDDLQMTKKDSELKRLSVVLGEGYAWPLPDYTQGTELPGTETEDSPAKRTGKIACKILDPTQMTWEPGKHYEDSRWHAVQCFYTKQEAFERWPGVWDNVESVESDATAQSSISGAIMDQGKSQIPPNLVSVWEYLERPSKKYPKGRYMVLTESRLLSEEDYPYLFPETNDEPWIVRFYYRQPPRRSRAQGMMESLIDPQRAYNRRRQLQSEWANFAAVPGVNIPREGGQQQDFKIEPGFRYYVTPGLNNGVQFVQPGEMPQSLMNSTNDIKQDMDAISGQYDFTKLASSAAAASIQQIVQQDEGRRGDIARGFQNSHAQLGRRFLLLARANYTETRDYTYKSRTGTNNTSLVASQELPSFINVTVKTGTPKSPGEVQATATQWASMPWGIAPEKVMLAIENNDLGEITGSFKLDKDLQERANKAILNLNPQEIAPLIAGYAGIIAEAAAAYEDQGVPFDPSMLSPPPGPWPHANPHANPAICEMVLTDWMKTQEYELMAKENQQVAQWLLQELQMMQQQAAQAQMAQQAATAQQQGATNASRPGDPAQAPSQASLQSQTPVDSNKQSQPQTPVAA